MNNVVNLRLARKRKARQEKSEAAEANRKLHGISKKLRNKARQESEVLNQRLDGKKRDPSD